MDWDEMKEYAPLALRVFLGAAFVVAGLDKIFSFSMASGMFESLFGGAGTALLVLVLAVELAGGLALVLGVYTRWAALVLMGVMVVAFVSTFKVGAAPHVFGTLREIMVMNTGGGNLPVNWAFFAGLLALFLGGSGSMALQPDE